MRATVRKESVQVFILFSIIEKLLEYYSEELRCGYLHRRNMTKGVVAGMSTPPSLSML